MTRTRSHRAPTRTPRWAPLVVVLGVLLILTAAVALRMTSTAAAQVPRSTVTVTRTVTREVPGPTTTVSYLIEVTVTPGVNGY